MSIVELLQYDTWATRRALGTVAKLTPAQFLHEFAEDVSVRQQAAHLISVSDRYRARIMHEPVPDVGFESFNSVEEIARYADQVSERMTAMIPHLNEQKLNEEVRNDTRKGLFILTVEQTLMQVVNHGTFHRGQIACLLKLHGIEPVDTDIILWLHDKNG